MVQMTLTVLMLLLMKPWTVMELIALTQQLIIQESVMEVMIRTVLTTLLSVMRLTVQIKHMNVLMAQIVLILMKPESAMVLMIPIV